MYRDVIVNRRSIAVTAVSSARVARPVDRSGPNMMRFEGQVNALEHQPSSY